MLEKIEHIGIAVKSIELGIIQYEKLYQSPCYKTEIVESEHVATAFFLIGTTKIELVASLNEGGIITKFIEKRGEGIHHIAYAVKDIYKSIAEYKKLGYVFLSEEPKIGADNKWVIFFHPKSSYGVLSELCMERMENI